MFRSGCLMIVALAVVGGWYGTRSGCVGDTGKVRNDEVDAAESEDAPPMADAEVRMLLFDGDPEMPRREQLLAVRVGDAYYVDGDRVAPDAVFVDRVLVAGVMYRLDAPDARDVGIAESSGDEDGDTGHRRANQAVPSAGDGPPGARGRP